MNFRLLWPIWAGLILALPLSLRAQTILTTKPLAVTSACPGSTLSVSFSLTFGTYTTNTIFTVQISDGGDFSDISTGKTLSPDGTTVDERQISATLPTDLAAHTTYFVRVRTTNPDYIGSPSPTQLFVKGKESKPPVPLVDSVNLACMGSSAADPYAYIYVRMASGATPRLYYDEQQDNFTEYMEFPNCLEDDLECRRNGAFQLSKSWADSYITSTYAFPVAERTYQISQRIDGCESERVSTKVRILWRPSSGPTPVNPLPNSGNHFGQLTYCWGEQAYPINVNGHALPPDNYQVLYATDATGQVAIPSSITPPVPDTHTVGSTYYTMGLRAIDASKGCPLQGDGRQFTHLTVTVAPSPSKPATTTSVISYYQGQTAIPLSATTTDSTATLVWYGTNATGGVGSGVAPTPPTNQVGPAIYYVAQKVGRCESERVPISVMVGNALGVDDPTLAEVVEVFPNPAVSSLTVRIRGLTRHQSARLELVDLAGQSLWQKETQQETAVLSMTDYPNGSYVLLINVGDRKTTRRIVKL